VQENQRAPTQLDRDAIGRIYSPRPAALAAPDMAWHDLTKQQFRGPGLQLEWLVC
jgi:hypothetical protein